MLSEVMAIVSCTVSNHYTKKGYRETVYSDCVWNEVIQT